MEIITYKEAKLRGLKHYYTGKPCNRGHLDKRLTSSTTCSACIRENHHRQYAANREGALASIKKWSEANRDKVASASQRYRDNNPGADSENARRYYNKNKEVKLNYNR